MGIPAHNLDHSIRLYLADRLSLFIDQSEYCQKILLVERSVNVNTFQLDLTVM